MQTFHSIVTFVSFLADEIRPCYLCVEYGKDGVLSVFKGSSTYSYLWKLSAVTMLSLRLSICVASQILQIQSKYFLVGRLSCPPHPSVNLPKQPQPAKDNSVRFPASDFKSPC